MDEKDPRQQEALFRYSVLGAVLSQDLKRGELRARLRQLAGQIWSDGGGAMRVVSWRTLETWYHRYRRDGFDGLLPRRRSDCGRTKVISAEQVELILTMKREDPGRSAPLIKAELERAGYVARGQLSLRSIQRLLRRHGLSRPKLELDRPERLRWHAAASGELWQADCVHGPKLHDPETGRALRVKIFGLLDDRSRLAVYLRAGFHETQEAFLKLLLGAVQRRGAPRTLFADQHKSFTGSSTHTACAQLGIRLLFARPYDGPAKGKVERFWRTLRGHVLDRLDLSAVTTLDALNLRLATWAESDYNRRPHSAHGGKTPLEVWEEDADQIRWVEDPERLKRAFLGRFTRHVRHDSTCTISGQIYEVPGYLRGQKVTIVYSLLEASRYWVEDGQTWIPLVTVDPAGNASRARQRAETTPPPAPAPTSGLNAVEDLLKRVSGRASRGAQ
ncbi:MAG: helix-turn-helix domain-containing protein [Pseudomonadales bacterium]|nr:helix-turn-helix domain-containing protein [Pseudomonadales bacterium]